MVVCNKKKSYMARNKMKCKIYIKEGAKIKIMPGNIAELPNLSQRKYQLRRFQEIREHSKYGIVADPLIKPFTEYTVKFRYKFRTVSVPVKGRLIMQTNRELRLFLKDLSNEKFYTLTELDKISIKPKKKKKKVETRKGEPS